MGVKMQVNILFCLFFFLSVGYGKQPNKILGGATAKKGSYPWQISLRRNGQHYCGGAIISRSYMLTAAHCIVDENLQYLTDIQVLTGTNDAEDETTGELHDVSEMLIHPAYSPDDITNDIAILQLVKPMKSTARQREITLATGDPPINAQARVAGWGQWRIQRLNQYPKYLQELTMILIDNQKCSRQLQIPISQEVLCAMQSREHNICGGDSGSPLVYKGQLVGITSRSDCHKDRPALFTRVSQFVPWIHQTIRNFANAWQLRHNYYANIQQKYQ